MCQVPTLVVSRCVYHVTKTFLFRIWKVADKNSYKDKKVRLRWIKFGLFIANQSLTLNNSLTDIQRHCLVTEAGIFLKRSKNYFLISVVSLIIPIISSVSTSSIKWLWLCLRNGKFMFIFQGSTCLGKKLFVVRETKDKWEEIDSQDLLLSLSSFLPSYPNLLLSCWAHSRKSISG